MSNMKFISQTDKYYLDKHGQLIIFMICFVLISLMVFCIFADNPNLYYYECVNEFGATLCL